MNVNMKTQKNTSLSHQIVGWMPKQSLLCLLLLSLAAWKYSWQNKAVWNQRVHRLSSTQMVFILQLIYNKPWIFGCVGVLGRNSCLWFFLFVCFQGLLRSSYLRTTFLKLASFGPILKMRVINDWSIFHKRNISSFR